jgi:putative transposase
MMETFKDMVNHCIRIGLENNCSTLKKLSTLSYHELKQYNMMSYYVLNAISQAAGRLAQRKHDIKKGKTVKSPFVEKPYLVSCYGFKINGMLLSFPISNRSFANILLNKHIEQKLSEDVEPRSFTITPDSLNLSQKTGFGNKTRISNRNRQEPKKRHNIDPTNYNVQDSQSPLN